MEKKRARVPLHWLAGVGIILAAEILLFAGNRWVKTYFTPLVWTGYIVLVDALLAARKGESPLTTRRGEFALLVPISILSWYVFEGVNLLLKNWSYVNLPRPPRRAGSDTRGRTRRYRRRYSSRPSSSNPFSASVFTVAGRS